MFFLILAGIKKSLLDMAVYWISITSDHMWLHSGHCCLFHCNVSFFLAEQKIIFVSASGLTEMVMINIKMHISCELWSMKDLKLWYIITGLRYELLYLLKEMCSFLQNSLGRRLLYIEENLKSFINLEK